MKSFLTVAAVLFAALCFVGVVDPEAGAAVLMAGTAAVDFKALETAMKAAFDKWGEKIKATADEQIDLRRMILELAQRSSIAPVQSGYLGADGELTTLISESEGLKHFLEGNTPQCRIKVPTRLVVKNALTNPAPGGADPLRQPDRSRGIVAPPEQRLTIRALFQQIPTSQGSIDVMRESTFTNNAEIQGVNVSPTGSGEGEQKPESAMTFTATTLQVPTIAHRIEASKQILSDVPRLQAHIDGRMLYGLMLEEEEQFLTGNGSGLNMSGINTQASAYNAGSTNATAMDTIARGINQLQLSNFEPSGVVLNPSDWLNSFKLAKDTQGRYLLGDPADMTMPALWGVPVIPTSSQPVGKFTVLDGRQLGYVADREEAFVTIGLINDQFIRNMVTILAEERSLIVIERPTAAVYGTLSHAG